MMNHNDPYEHLTVNEVPPADSEGRDEEEPQAGVEIQFDKLFEYLQMVLEEGSVRRLILRDRRSRVLLDVPLGPSALVGAVGFLLMPLWLRIMTVVGVLSSITVEIQREIREEGDHSETASEQKQRITIEHEDEGPPDSDIVV